MWRVNAEFSRVALRRRPRPAEHFSNPGDVDQSDECNVGCNDLVKLCLHPLGHSAGGRVFGLACQAWLGKYRMPTDFPKAVVWWGTGDGWPSATLPPGEKRLRYAYSHVSLAGPGTRWNYHPRYRSQKAGWGTLTPCTLLASMHKTCVWLPAMAALATRVFRQQDWLFALPREACFGNRTDSLLSNARKPRSRTAENDRPGGACSGNWSGRPGDYGKCRFPELPAPGRRTPRSPLQ